MESGIGSTDLYPIQHLDEHEFFPGDFVVESKDGFHPHTYGVVQVKNYVREIPPPFIALVLDLFRSVSGTANISIFSCIRILRGKISTKICNKNPNMNCSKNVDDKNFLNSEWFIKF